MRPPPNNVLLTQKTLDEQINFFQLPPPPQNTFTNKGKKTNEAETPPEKVFEIYEKQEVTYDYSVKTKKKESDKVFLSSLAKAVCILHNKGIVHAGISPYSVGIADGKVFLGGFYNSFLRVDLSMLPFVTKSVLRPIPKK